MKPERRIKERWRELRNKRMAEKLSARGYDSALSVLDEGEAIGGGLYKLRRFVEGRDYCDPNAEAWIWSIGRNRMTGEIFASTFGSSFYQDDDYECLFLR